MIRLPFLTISRDFLSVSIRTFLLFGKDFFPAVNKCFYDNEIIQAVMATLQYTVLENLTKKVTYHNIMSVRIVKVSEMIME